MNIYDKLKGDALVIAICRLCIESLRRTPVPGFARMIESNQRQMRAAASRIITAATEGR